MARIRSIKPEFWTSEQVMECSPLARLLFIGIWNFCDDGGNHPDAEKTLKALIFPGDDIDSASVRRLLDELSEHRLLTFYERDGKRYLHVNGWRHQKIERPTFKFPCFVEAPQEMGAADHVVDDKSTSDQRALAPGEEGERKGEEKSKEQEQPLPLRGGSDRLRDRLLGLLARRFSADSAVDLHNEVQGFLEEQGFECVREYPVEDRGDGREGRVDLVVKGDDGSLCGIELDRDTPRQKSLFKLAQLPAAIVLLRSPYDGPDCIDGVAVISAVSAPPVQSSARKKRDPAFDPLTAKPDNVSVETWAKWVQHRREIRKPLTPTSCNQQAAQLATHPNPDSVIAASIASGWQGLFPDRVARSTNARPSNFTNLPKHTPDQYQEEPDHDGPNF